MITSKTHISTLTEKDISLPAGAIVYLSESHSWSKKEALKNVLILSCLTTIAIYMSKKKELTEIV